MQFAVKNESPGARMIQTTKRHVSLTPGQELVLELSPTVARRHAEAAARKPGKYMKITPVDEEARAALSGASSAAVPQENREVVAPTENPPVADHPMPVQSKSAAAKELASRVDSTDIAVLRGEARMVLGDRWPRNAGNINREKIKELLDAAAAETQE